MTDTQADLTERVCAYGSGREIVDALAGLTGEEGEIVCQEDALIAEIDFALQSERDAAADEIARLSEQHEIVCAQLAAMFERREAAAAEARRAAIDECAQRVLRTGWPNCEDAAGIIRDLASPPAPQEE